MERGREGSGLPPAQESSLALRDHKLPHAIDSSPSYRRHRVNSLLSACAKLPLSWEYSIQSGSQCVRCAAMGTQGTTHVWRSALNRLQEDHMVDVDPEVLKPLAQKYIWWTTPEDAVKYPLRVIAQVMNIGDYDDVQALITSIGNEPFCETIRRAEAGWFDKRSWAYWHYRLRLINVDKVPPPLPVRTFT